MVSFCCAKRDSCLTQVGHGRAVCRCVAEPHATSRADGGGGLGGGGGDVSEMAFADAPESRVMVKTLLPSVVKCIKSRSSWTPPLANPLLSRNGLPVTC